MISTVFRGMHRYLALFFVPWLLVYALSAVVLNHREFFREKFGFGKPVVIKEREIVYTGTFPRNAGPNMMAGQILSDLRLDGSHGDQENKNKGTITIWRGNPVKPRELTFTPSTGNLVVKREEFNTAHFLRNMHFRRGYGQKYLADDAWAVVLDVVIFSIIFWGVSGVMMWWSRRDDRRIGSIVLAAGVGLFTLFLFAI